MCFGKAAIVADLASDLPNLNFHCHYSITIIIIFFGSELDSSSQLLALGVLLL